MGIFRYLLTFCYPNDSLTKWFEDIEKSKSKLVHTPTYSLCILLLFLNYCPYSGCILTRNWIVTLQKFMILAVNPLQAEDRNVKHNSLQDLLGVWFMQILLNRFLPLCLWIVSLYNLGSADIYNAKAITSCNHPNCIDSFISTTLFIWKILSMDPCITFMSCWAHKYSPWISPYKPYRVAVSPLRKWKWWPSLCWLFPHEDLIKELENYWPCHILSQALKAYSVSKACSLCHIDPKIMWVRNLSC